jgi:hypothetical protein
MYNIVPHMSYMITKVLEFSPDVTLKINLLGSRLASCNALLQHLVLVQLTQGTDKFRWNLYESGKLSMKSMSSALIQPELPVYNNKKKIEGGDSAKN